MAGLGRQFRVFLSSAFSDMHAEREVLQRRVFPRLQRFCQRRGAHFLAVDLRWGVSEEAGLDQRTMPLCLSEIRRCQEMTPRPNFLVLLGQRYGWQPLPYEIPKPEYEQLQPMITAADARALLEQWYRLDTNALPDGAFVLRTRTGEFEEPDVWARQVERPLQRSLADAVTQLDWPEKQARTYVASATEQEIAEGALRADIDHALCFLRTITGLSENGSDGHYVDSDPEAQARLTDLKTRLRKHLPGNVVEYETPWRDGVQQDDLKRFAAQVYRRLRRAIAAELADAEVLDPLEQENRDHAAFGSDRLRGFIGREAALEQVQEYLRKPGGSPLMLHGPSGCGKSALMARCTELVQETLPEAVRIVRFIGATPQSTELRSLLTELCAQLGREYGDEADIPQEINGLKEDFARRLRLVTPKRPVVLLLDALDQLNPNDAAHSLSWLPTELPVGVRLIVSVLERDDEAGACWRVARHRIAEDHRGRVPLLHPEEGAAILEEWLAQAGRALTEEQRESVLAGFAQSGLPLYLRLAFEEARLWRSYDGVPCGADDRSGLGKDVPGVIRDLLCRLSCGGAHGAVLVRQALGCLDAARKGLTDQEMLEILWRDAQVREDFRRRSPRSPATDSLPPIIWSRLYFDLAPYLVQRSADGTALLGFYHRQFAEVVAEEYLSEEQAESLHRELAAYFGDQPSWLVAEGAERRSNLRKASELVTQQVGGECWDAVEGTLTDLEFLEAKADGGQVFDLATDFTRCNRVFPQHRMWARNLRLLEQALRNDLHFIARHPTTLFQCFWNSARWYDCPEAANHYDPPEGGWGAAGPPWERPEPKLCTLLERWRKGKDTLQPGFVWVRSMRPPTFPLLGAQTACLRGHEGVVSALAFSPDGRTVASGCGGGTTLLSEGAWVVLLWDISEGSVAWRFEHSAPVRALAFLDGGQLLATSSHDGFVRIWETASGKIAAQLTTDDRLIAASANGQWLVFHSSGLRVLDARSGVVREVARTEPRSLLDLACSPRGDKVAACSDTGTRMWSLRSHGRYVETELPCNATRLTFSRRGTEIVTGMSDGSIDIWSATDGQHVRRVTREGNGVTCLTVSPNGEQIAFGGSRTSIRVVSRNGHLLACLKGHEGSVEGLCFSPCGGMLASCSYDETVRLWDWRNADSQPRLWSHADNITQMYFSPNGLCVISDAWEGRTHTTHLFTGQDVATVRANLGTDPQMHEWRIRQEPCGLTPTVLDSEFRIAEPGRWQALGGQSVSGASRVAPTSVGKPIAWYPRRPDIVLGHPWGDLFALAEGSHLRVLRLEGAEIVRSVALTDEQRHDLRTRADALAVRASSALDGGEFDTAWEAYRELCPLWVLLRDWVRLRDALTICMDILARAGAFDNAVFFGGQIEQLQAILLRGDDCGLV